MITKERLLDFMQEALKTEESAIPLYTQHVSSTLFLSGFPKDKQERILNILKQLNEESSRHSRTYMSLIEKITAEDKDVY